MSELAQQCEEISDYSPEFWEEGSAEQIRSAVAGLLAYIAELKAEHIEIEEMREIMLAKSRRIEELALQLSTASEQLDQWHELDKANKSTIADMEALNKGLVQENAGQAAAIGSLQSEHVEDRKELIRTQALVTSADAACIRKLQSSIAQLQSELAGLRRPIGSGNAEIERIVRTSEEYGDNTIYSLADIKVLLLEIARLSMPVVQSDEIEAIRKRRAADYALSVSQFTPVVEYSTRLAHAAIDVSVLLRALDHSEREKALVGEALMLAIETRGGLGFNARDPVPTFRLGGDPIRDDLRRVILLQYAGSNKT